MPITATQVEHRKKHLGSSDMAAVLGLSPFLSAYDVWLEKTGKLVDREATGQAAGASPIAAGNYLEDGVLAFAEKTWGKITRNQFRSLKADGIPLAASVDGILTESGIPVEAKTAGVIGPTRGTWGDEDTDQVPDHVLIQVHVHMLCTEQPVCYVPTLVGGRGFLRFVVQRNDAVADVITNAAIEFWQKHVLADIPPANSTPHIDVVKRMRREPNKTVAIETRVVETWLAAKDAASAADKVKKEAEAVLLAALGDAEGGISTLGTLTYFEQERKAYTVPESKYRVLRLKKEK
jgi:putative phage-type endonuclease